MSYEQGTFYIILIDLQVGISALTYKYALAYKHFKSNLKYEIEVTFVTQHRCLLNFVLI